jgi:phosphoribosylformylglycinamidine (FGAM) synthase-like amidotransferase family enzyme
MAAAFDRAGFAAIDVHMSDILAGRVDFEDFKGLVACGGFSYGDVLGAGEGWAKSACSTPVPAMPSRPSSSVPTASPWACATVAR